MEDVEVPTWIKLTVKKSQEFSFHPTKLITSRSNRIYPQSFHTLFMGHVAGAGAGDGISQVARAG